jgi:hypothetical protein
MFNLEDEWKMKISAFIKRFITPSISYEVPWATEETHETCQNCGGSGHDDIFHDCNICKGTGIVKKLDS